MREIIQIAALRRIDDADSFHRNIERFGNFFDLRAVTQQNRHAETKGIELAGSLKHPRLGSFRKNNPFRMSLQLLDDTANETHGFELTHETIKGNCNH